MWSRPVWCDSFAGGSIQFLWPAAKLVRYSNENEVICRNRIPVRSLIPTEGLFMKERAGDRALNECVPMARVYCAARR